MTALYFVSFEFIISIMIVNRREMPPWLSELTLQYIHWGLLYYVLYLQVVSSDRDTSPENKAVNYSILSGDHMNVFDIHPTDGSIIVRSKLDREAVSALFVRVMMNLQELFNV